MSTGIRSERRFTGSGLQASDRKVYFFSKPKATSKSPVAEGMRPVDAAHLIRCEFVQIQDFLPVEGNNGKVRNRDCHKSIFIRHSYHSSLALCLARKHNRHQRECQNDYIHIVILIIYSLLKNPANIVIIHKKSTSDLTSDVLFSLHN